MTFFDHWDCLGLPTLGTLERIASMAPPRHCSGRALHGDKQTPAMPTWAGGSSSPAYETTEIYSHPLLTIKTFSYTQIHSWGDTL